jgi:hypothetical protein
MDYGAFKDENIYLIPYILQYYESKWFIKLKNYITVRWYIPVALLNANECCNQSTQQYIQ